MNHHFAENELEIYISSVARFLALLSLLLFGLSFSAIWNWWPIWMRSFVFCRHINSDNAAAYNFDYLFIYFLRLSIIRIHSNMHDEIESENEGKRARDIYQKTSRHQFMYILCEFNNSSESSKSKWQFWNWNSFFMMICLQFSFNFVNSKKKLSWIKMPLWWDTYSTTTILICSVKLGNNHY